MDGKLLALASSVCFGINPILIKRGLKNSSSNTAVVVSLISGWIVLTLSAPGFGGFQLDKLTVDATIFFVLSGVFGVILGRVTFYWTIEKLGSSRASTVKNSAPVITTVLAVFVLNESLDLLRWGAIGLVTAGLMLIGRDANTQAKNRIVWYRVAPAVLTPLFYGMRPLFSKMGLNLLPLPFTASFVGYSAAVLIYACYFWIKERDYVDISNVRSGVWFGLGGILQVVGLVALYFAYEHSDISVVYPISASAPLVTFLLSYTILRNVEKLNLMDLIGTTAVVAGVIMLLN